MNDSSGAKRLTLTRESLLLIGISVVDLAATLLLVGTNVAAEGNPVMGFYLRYGVGTFVLVKLSLIFLPIFIAEWSKQYKPKFVRMMLRATIAAYLGIYLVLFLSVNLIPAIAQVEYSRPAQHTQVRVSK